MNNFENSTASSGINHDIIAHVPDSTAEIIAENPAEARRMALVAVTAGVLAVGLALATPNSSINDPGIAEARSKTANPVRLATPKKPKPEMALHVLRPSTRSACTPKQNVSLSLRSSKTVDSAGKIKYQMIAKKCYGKKGSAFKSIRLVAAAPPKEGQRQKQKRAWRIKNPASDYRGNRRTFRLWNTSKTAHEYRNPDKPKNQIQLSAYNSKGRRLGKSVYDLSKVKYSSGTKSKPSAGGSSQNADQSCTPDPKFRVGAQADNEVVFQEHMDTQTAVGLLRSTLGITALRINIMPGQVREKGGLDTYIRAIDIAKNNGIKDILATVMPNPEYMPSEPGEPHASDFGLEGQHAMYAFAKKVSTTLGPRVVRYSAINEPNHPYFSRFYTSKDQEFLTPVIWPRTMV